MKNATYKNFDIVCNEYFLDNIIALKEGPVHVEESDKNNVQTKRQAENYEADMKKKKIDRTTKIHHSSHLKEKSERKLLLNYSLSFSFSSLVFTPK